MASGLNFQLREIQNNIKKFGKRLEEASVEVMEAVTQDQMARAKRRFQPGKLGDPESDVRDKHGLLPHRQTGALSRALGTKVERDREAITGVVFASEVVAQYAATVELGGTIKPRTAKFLAIPLNKKAKRLQVRAGGSLRGVTSPRLFVIALPGGGLYLAAARRDARQKGKGLEFLFKLAKSVTVRPHPFLLPALLDSQPGVLRAAATLRRLFR